MGQTLSMGAEWIDIKERDSTGLHNTSDGNHHSEGVNKLHASKCGHVGEC